MRIALPASGAIHIGLLIATVAVMNSPAELDGSGLPAVSVDIVSFESLSDASSSESTATEELVAAGVEAVAAEPVDIAEPIETIEPADPTQAIDQVEKVEPIEPDSTEPAEAETLLDAATEPLAAESTQVAEASEPEAITKVEAVLASSAETIETVAAVEPVMPSEVLEPISEAELKVAPVPHVLTRPRSSEPTYPQRRQAPTQPRQQAAPIAQASSGSSGADEADSAASAASSATVARQSVQDGAAATEQYQSGVYARIRRAHRQPRGARFEGRVVVSFQVSGGGGISSVRVAASSGDPAMDQAALETIHRAAPFAPIPASVGASSLNFAIPVDFDR